MYDLGSETAGWPRLRGGILCETKTGDSETTEPRTELPDLLRGVR